MQSVKLELTCLGEKRNKYSDLVLSHRIPFRNEWDPYNAIAVQKIQFRSSLS